MSEAHPLPSGGAAAAENAAAERRVVRRSEQDEQYELVLDGVVVSVLGYSMRDGAIVLLHTATEPDLRGRGHASELAGAVLADVARQGLTPLVRCPFIRSYLRKHAGEETQPET